MKKLIFSTFFPPNNGAAALHVYKMLKKSKSSLDILMMEETNQDKDFSWNQNAEMEIHPLEKLHPWSELKRNWGGLKYVLKAIKWGINNSKKYDTFVSFSFPVWDHIPPYILNKIFKQNKKWIAVFGDPMAASHYYKHEYKGLGAKAGHKLFGFIESFAIRNADYLVFTNEFQQAEMLERYGNLYNEKSIVCYHGFEKKVITDKILDPKYIYISHIGGIYGRRSIKYFLDVFMDFLTTYPEYQIKVKLLLIGDMENREKELLESFKYPDNIENLGKVTYQESLIYMQNSDILLLIDGIFPEENQNIYFASKLADYLSTFKPILANTMEIGITANIMDKTGNIILPVDKSEAIQVLKNYLDGNVHIDKNEYEKFELDLVMKDFLEVLDN